VDPSKGYKGITCFVVEKDMGVKVAKKEQKLGIRASSTCTLDFDDVKVPLENVIGGEGKGYKVRCAHTLPRPLLAFLTSCAAPDGD
jgi:short/branched chain acyl-CoA dehydrogenase